MLQPETHAWFVQRKPAGQSALCTHGTHWCVEVSHVGAALFVQWLFARQATHVCVEMLHAGKPACVQFASVMQSTQVPATVSHVFAPRQGFVAEQPSTHLPIGLQILPGTQSLALEHSTHEADCTSHVVPGAQVG